MAPCRVRRLQHSSTHRTRGRVVDLTLRPARVDEDGLSGGGDGGRDGVPRGPGRRDLLVDRGACSAHPRRRCPDDVHAGLTDSMRLAHVRERHAPAGAPWRLAAALDDPPTRWLDLEVARRRAVAARPDAAHDAVLFRQPVTTLDDHLARGPARRGPGRPDRGVRGSRRGRRGGRAARPTSCSARRCWRRRRCGTATASRATSARCGSGAAARSPRPGTAWRSSISRTSRRSAGRAIPSGRRARSEELDYELEVAALIDTPVRDLTPGACRGGDRRLHDLQRLVGARPAARRDGGPARAGEGQGLRELVRAVAGHARRARGRPLGARLRPRDDGVRERASRRRAVAGPTRSTVWPTSRRARRRTRCLRPGDLIGSGTVGTGCLLEVRDGDAGALPRARRRGQARGRAARRGCATPVVARPG